uniref:F-box domain-containing protein n=1 Tax=Physcomitrium patens TaxID=3218 RepID=A0A7I4DDW0_PHYPA
MGTLVQNRQILLSSSTGKLNFWSLYRSDMTNFAGCSEFHTNRILESSSPVLDSQIWSNLQPELVARILARLPLSSLIHTRLVSKSWDREIYSGRVMGDGSVHENPRSWLFLFENGGPGNPHKLHAFDPLRNDWQTFTTIPHFATVQKIGGLSLCGAASGLMVYKISALKSHFIRFGVFNPITRSWKKLPPLLKRRQRPVVSMFAEGSGYRLVVAGGLEYDQQVLTTEVYDSRTECWRTTCEKFNNLQSHVCDEIRTSTAFCDGVVYHMRFTRMLSFDPNREYHTFMAYDTKTARWRPLRVPLPPNLVFTGYPSLKRIWKGRAYLADVLPPYLMCPKICMSAYVDPSSYLKYELQGAGHGDIVYIFQANEGQGFVVLCDFSQSPPAWRCIRNGIVPKVEYSQTLQGCVIDLRWDTMI